MKNRFRILDKDFWKQVDNAVNNRPGIYKLLCLNENGPVPVPRIAGVDNEGILYIGKSENGELRYRLGSLKKSLDTSYADRGAHSAGSRYHFHSDIRKNYPLEGLFVSILSTDSQSGAGKLEKEELIKYQEQFGELPPFNRQS